MSAHTATTMAVASGKGGAGKTNVAVNLAVALARLGHRVALVDADYGRGGVDVLLGLAPAHRIGQLLDGAASLERMAAHGRAAVPRVRTPFARTAAAGAVVHVSAGGDTPGVEGEVRSCE